VIGGTRPDDYVICTGETHTIRDFLDAAFLSAGIDNWHSSVVIDPEFYRPAEVDYLRGINDKAKNKLGWTPKHSFKELVHMMVQHDLK
jgi:GDPmannose 4,6-dehydratase